MGTASDDCLLSPPRIVCAANRNDSGVIVIGVRHLCPLMRQSIKDKGEKFTNWEQGFVDQHGFFYTRSDAWKVAFKNKQIIKLVGSQEYVPEGTLYSENLY